MRAVNVTPTRLSDFFLAQSQNTSHQLRYGADFLRRVLRFDPAYVRAGTELYVSGRRTPTSYVAPLVLPMLPAVGSKAAQFRSAKRTRGSDFVTLGLSFWLTYILPRHESLVLAQ